MTQTMTPTLSAPTPQAQPGQPQYTITDDDRARQKRIEAAWKAYHGELDKPLSRMEGQPDDNVMSNRCQPIVDRGVDFLFGKEIEISVEEGAPKEAQDFLNKVWGRKETRIPMLQKLAMNGAIAGCGFLRIMPDKKGNYRLIVVDPSIVFVQTAPQDVETVLLYCIEYCTDQKIDGHPQHVYYREEIARIDPDGNASRGEPDDDDTWSIQHWTRIGDRGKWQAAGEPIVWAYNFPPLFDCQNLPNPNDFWGTPDLTPDLIGLNNALNLVNSCINRVEKIYGGPILYAPGTGETVIDVKPGKIIQLPLPDNKIEAVAIHSDVPNALAFASDIRSDMDEQSSVPGVATGRIKDMPRGNLSGIAIELLFMPVTKKNDKKKCTYGELLIDVSKALLVLNGMSGDIDIALAWISPLPHDDLPAVQAGIAKLEIGISKTSVQRELNYDPDEEAELKASEDAAALANFTKGQGMPPAGLPPGIPGSPALPGQQFPPATPPGQPQQQGGAL